MIIKRFNVCPICAHQGHDYGWKHINHNSSWWEFKCLGYYEPKDSGCCFSQYFFKSHDDPECKYLNFNIKDYNVYLYSDQYDPECNSLNPNGKTYFFHKIFPRGESVQNPFQIWDQFVIDWNNLDKLNNKLNLLKKFV